MIPNFRAYYDKKMWDVAKFDLWGDPYQTTCDLAPFFPNDEELFDIYLSEVELMQSTGLKDKNCKEIFEGDIVVNQYGNVGYIAYLKQEAGFVVVLKKSDYRLGHRNTGESYDVTNNHSIIGNIYQNSDLLESVEE